MDLRSVLLNKYFDSATTDKLMEALGSLSNEEFNEFAKLLISDPDSVKEVIEKAADVTVDMKQVKKANTTDPITTHKPQKTKTSADITMEILQEKYQK